ncbi:MAG: aminotransferase class V-fold PLP-dependent enzyme [Chloroflexota bacterium]
MDTPLIPKNKFIGLDDVVHLATGGESPMLVSHRGMIRQFIQDKAQGEQARGLQAEVVQQVQQKSAQLLSVDPDDITFLSSASDGVNVVAYGLDWKAGDNVIVADVEFPSDVLPWTQLEKQGVEIRIVRHKAWQISLEDIAAQIDDRTRVVAISYVSMFTGQRLNLPALSELVRSSNALLLLDATHAVGVVPVEAHYADIVVSSCYKWLLGVHGTAIFYWNRNRLPDLYPPFLGWNSTPISPGWENPTEYTLHNNAHRFLAGNPSFIGLYILDNALDHILELGIDAIEAHALALSGNVWEGVNQMGWEMMTPQDAPCRAGNVCFMAPDVNAITKALAEQNVLVWGAYAGVGRVRISTHLYNDTTDVDRCLEALAMITRN